MPTQPTKQLNNDTPLVELKAIAYDLTVEIQRLTNFLKQVNGLIGKKSQEEKVAPKPVAENKENAPVA